MEKNFHIEFKETGLNYYHEDTDDLFKTWKNIRVSKYVLDTWNYKTPFENDICIISNLLFEKQKNRGGSRINAGYKGKYIEDTVPISLRVPISKEKEIREKIKEICEPLIRMDK
jgi:hypothetical protein